MDESHLLLVEVALAVRVVECRGDLRSDEERELGRHRLPHLGSPLEDALEVVAVDELHRDVVGVGDLAEIVDVDDVVVVELRRELRLVDEHRDELFVVRHVRQDLLDRHRFLEAFDALHPGFPDLGHSARRNLLEQRVLAEADAVVILSFRFLDARRRGEHRSRRTDGRCGRRRRRGKRSRDRRSRRGRLRRGSSCGNRCRSRSLGRGRRSGNRAGNGLFTRRRARPRLLQP